MAAASERQALLRSPRLPFSTLRYATAAVVMISTVTLFIISFSNVLTPAPQPRLSFLLDRSVAGTVAPPPQARPFWNHAASQVASSRSTLYQRELASLNKANPPSLSHMKAFRASLMGAKKPQPLLFPVVAKVNPYSAPYNVYMLWSRVMQDMSPGATGDIFRRALRLGHVEGGEYRDAKFLPELAGRQFDDIAATCCSVVAVPPLSGGFIVYGANGRRAEMIRAFLANGNAMVIAGGVVALEFLNRMFYSQLEPVDSNYDEGPFRKASSAFGPWKKLPFDSLGQIGTDVYAVKPASLPEGSSVLFASPDGVGAFIMPFCQRLNPQYGNPTPIIIPSSRCKSLQATGKGKCSCGTVTCTFLFPPPLCIFLHAQSNARLSYLGYDFHDNSITSAQDHAKYDGSYLPRELF